MLQEHSYIPARDVRAIKNFDVKKFVNEENFDSLRAYGINIHKDSTYKLMHAMDNLQPLITTASITTPIQFLQNWLPGFVHIITAARKIDDLVGIATIGTWEDEQIVLSGMELVGTSVPYGDYTNLPLASWNTNFVPYTVVRFEEGMMVSNLEEARASRINVNSGASKRESAALALEIQRNSVGFVGFNGGLNATYGFLNFPQLPAYVTAANGASGSASWARKTFKEIQADILSMIVGVRFSSQDNVDPESVDMTLALATVDVDYLATTTDFGISVRDWMTKTYPRIRVVSAPQLTAANGGQNVAYLYADRINDMSTDDGRTFMQVVPAKFQVQGVQKLVKGYQEGYTNATAGVICKRPYAVYRLTGI